MTLELQNLFLACSLFFHAWDDDLVCGDHHALVEDGEVLRRACPVLVVHVDLDSHGEQHLPRSKDVHVHVNIYLGAGLVVDLL